MTEHATMQDYALRLIRRKEKALENFSPFSSPLEFQRIKGQIDVLYIMLTGWNNPQSNPLIETNE
jgi:hypothetical protein